ncbi:MAG TPA: nucleotidyltransferase family protein [bacterium]|nr:nucleotidyltransferase family protein [bacterium]HQI47927.1 nucleotidyltransferase family protein [bacterium]HQJ64412.1 nucleotidyltransferase family protein [bacterium]HQJ65524.1 nucleotidyltransferase family protein [bacterium]
MNGLILAAGYATRLYPLTRNFPKPLLPVGGRAILDRLLEDLEAIPAVRRHIVVTNATFFPHFEQWKRRSRYAKELVLVNDGTTSNENRFGAVRDLLHVIETLQLNEDLLVLAGDNVVDFSFRGLVDYAETKATSCITCHHEPSRAALQKTGVLIADADFRVEAIQEKPQHPASHWAVPPFYLYRASDLGLIRNALAEGCGSDAPGNLAAWLCRRTPMHAWVLPGRRYDIGDLDSYEAVNKLFSA